jgi:hypothetical protein
VRFAPFFPTIGREAVGDITGFTQKPMGSFDLYDVSNFPTTLLFGGFFFSSGNSS